MVKIFLAVVFFSSISMTAVLAQADYTVKILVHNDNVSTHVGEDFYVTGSFNSWQPAESLIGKFPAAGESILISIPNVPGGLLEYKFTRGTWQTVVTARNGSLEEPLHALVESDTLLHANIEGWRDDFPSSTASAQVGVLDSAFYFPSLNLDRRIWIYLPKDYAASSKRYPVIYMHDGDDLFDEATSKGRIGPVEWRVDETIDHSSHDAIVIGIAQAEDIPQRQLEYFVYPTGRFQNPVGDKYMADIVHTLKPYVDQHFRTLSDTKNTAMVGSSVGGLFTFYAGLKYSEIFGTLGVLSPSFWLDHDNIETAVRQIADTASLERQQYFFYGGGNENREKPDGSYVRMDEDLQKVASLLKEKTASPVEVSISPEGRHGAWYWQQAFPLFFEWWEQQLDK